MFHGQWYSIKSKPAQGWYYYMLVPLLHNENKTEIIWIFQICNFGYNLKRFWWSWGKNQLFGQNLSLEESGSCWRPGGKLEACLGPFLKRHFNTVGVRIKFALAQAAETILILFIISNIFNSIDLDAKTVDGDKVELMFCFLWRRERIHTFQLIQGFPPSCSPGLTEKYQKSGRERLEACSHLPWCKCCSYLCFNDSADGEDEEETAG